MIYTILTYLLIFLSGMVAGGVLQNYIDRRKQKRNLEEWKQRQR